MNIFFSIIFALFVGLAKAESLNGEIEVYPHPHANANLSSPFPNFEGNNFWNTSADGQNNSNGSTKAKRGFDECGGCDLEKLRKDLVVEKLENLIDELGGLKGRCNNNRCFGFNDLIEMDALANWHSEKAKEILDEINDPFWKIMAIVFMALSAIFCIAFVISLIILLKMRENQNGQFRPNERRFNK